MRYVNFAIDGINGIGVLKNGVVFGCTEQQDLYPGTLESLIRTHKLNGELSDFLLSLDHFDAERISYLPPLTTPHELSCIGLKYVDHSKEIGFKPTTYPTVFSRFTSSLLGHKQAIVKPRVSDMLDFEGELAAVIGRAGRHIPKDSALDYVVGYSVFNDASIRDYQTKSPQWTIGKNFDNTGAFGPHLVSADELPLGCHGLTLQTRLNGKVMQEANTRDLIFDIASLVATLSEAMTLEAGDVIVTGTPAGIGWTRKPPLFMQVGDVCEVEIEQVGLLRNTVVAEE